MRLTLNPSRALGRDDRGMAAIEFAMSLGAVVTLGVYGTEMSNLALAHLQGQPGRAGPGRQRLTRRTEKSSLAQQQLREATSTTR